MSLLRWDSFADMAQLRDQVNRLFEQSLTRTGQEPASTKVWAPAVDIMETKDAVMLHMEIAGITPGEINIQVTEDMLTVKGERRMARREDGRQVIRQERSYGPFQRSFTLGVPVDQQRIRASYRDGVLEIVLHKREEQKPKQVKIDVQSGPESGDIDVK